MRKSKKLSKKARKKEDLKHFHVGVSVAVIAMLVFSMGLYSSNREGNSITGAVSGLESITGYAVKDTINEGDGVFYLREGAYQYGSPSSNQVAFMPHRIKPGTNGEIIQVYTNGGWHNSHFFGRNPDTGKVTWLVQGSDNKGGIKWSFGKEVKVYTNPTLDELRISSNSYANTIFPPPNSQIYEVVGDFAGESTWYRLNTDGTVEIWNGLQFVPQYGEGITETDLKNFGPYAIKRDGIKYDYYVDSGGNTIRVNGDMLERLTVGEWHEYGRLSERDKNTLVKVEAPVRTEWFVGDKNAEVERNGNYLRYYLYNDKSKSTVFIYDIKSNVYITEKVDLTKIHASSPTSTTTGYIYGDDGNPAEVRYDSQDKKWYRVVDGQVDKTSEITAMVYKNKADVKPVDLSWTGFGTTIPTTTSTPTLGVVGDGLYEFPNYLDGTSTWYRVNGDRVESSEDGGKTWKTTSISKQDLKNFVDSGYATKRDRIPTTTPAATGPVQPVNTFSLSPQQIADATTSNKNFERSSHYSSYQDFLKTFNQKGSNPQEIAALQLKYGQTPTGKLDRVSVMNMIAIEVAAKQGIEAVTVMGLLQAENPSRVPTIGSGGNVGAGTSFGLWQVRYDTPAFKTDRQKIFDQMKGQYGITGSFDINNPIHNSIVGAAIWNQGVNYIRSQGIVGAGEPIHVDLLYAHYNGGAGALRASSKCPGKFIYECAGEVKTKAGHDVYLQTRNGIARMKAGMSTAINQQAGFLSSDLKITGLTPISIDAKGGITFANDVFVVTRTASNNYEITSPYDFSSYDSSGLLKTYWNGEKQVDVKTSRLPTDYLSQTGISLSSPTILHEDNFGSGSTYIVREGNQDRYRIAVYGEQGQESSMRVIDLKTGESRDLTIREGSAFLNVDLASRVSTGTKIGTLKLVKPTVDTVVSEPVAKKLGLQSSQASKLAVGGLVVTPQGKVEKINGGFKRTTVKTSKPVDGKVTETQKVEIIDTQGKTIGVTETVTIKTRQKDQEKQKGAPYDFITSKVEVTRDASGRTVKTFAINPETGKETGKWESIKYDNKGKPIEVRNQDGLDRTKLATLQEQHEIRGYFTSIERSLTEFQGLSYFPTLFLGDEALESWREGVDEAFATLYLGTEYWASDICSQFIDRDGQGIAYANTASGLATVSAHIEGSRSEAIILPPGVPSGDVAAEEENIPNAGPDQYGVMHSDVEFLYKITFHVQNGEHKSDPAGLENMRFNVILKGDRTVPLYTQKIELKKGASFGATGSSAIVQFSNSLYNQVCIKFDDVPRRWTLSGNELCNKISTATGPTSISAGEAPTTTAPAQASGGNINDI